MKIIRDRLTDKAEEQPSLVMEYINEDQREDLVSAALNMALYSTSSERFQFAQDRVKEIFDSALDDYISDHEDAEEREYLQEQREEAAEMRADAQRDEAYGEALMGAV